ncbi:MAG: ATP-binding protein, partial [Cyanobacteria bacterium J06649_11]
MDYDPDALSQVITNLVGNALKFTPSGGDISVKVLTNKDQLVLKIIDTGRGIHEKDLPNIFNRFYQSGFNEPTISANGVGIGLAFCKELCQLMEGEICVESILGSGSTFAVKLPISNVAPLVEEKIPTPNLSSVFPQLPPQQEKSQVAKQLNETETTPLILIVEDNPDVVTYLRSCLQLLYRLEVAYNGRIGLERAIDLVPDIIISDVMMPEKDGFTLCEDLKADERTSHIPIILLTARADIASKISGLKRGADAYLAKPFNKEELLVRTQQMLVQRVRLQTHLKHQQNQIDDQTQAIPTTAQELVLLQVSLKFENEFLQRVQKIIEQNYTDEDFGLPLLCSRLKMSRSQLFRKLKALLGISPSELIKRYRLEKAKS